MSNHAPSRSLSCLLLLAGPFGALAFGQSNVRPVPVVGRAPRAADGTHGDARTAEEASYLTLASSAVPGGEEETRNEAVWRADLDLEAAFVAAADLEGAGERSVQRAGWSAALRRERDDRAFALFLDTEASFYDWSSAGPLAGGSSDPFNDIYRTSVGALCSFAEDGPVSWFTGMEVNLHGEDGAGLGDALSVGAVTGVDVLVSPDLTLSFGLAALTRLEDSTWVLPYFGFDWRAAEWLRLATDGASVLAEVPFADDWTATLAARYELRQYRLNDDGPIPSGVYRDDQITLSGTLARRLGAHAQLALTAGMVVWQESTFLDEGGAKLGEVETDAAPFGALTLSFGL